MNPQGDFKQSDRRLNSWKSIAAYFERDERTVKRWESQRGLPVHRVPGAGRSSVYAYTDELSEWLKTAGTHTPLSPVEDCASGGPLPIPPSMPARAPLRLVVTPPAAVTAQPVESANGRKNYRRTILFVLSPPPRRFHWPPTLPTGGLSPRASHSPAAGRRD